ncbi:protein kinase domain-containing protein [Haliangium sp.]|uniref:protein kinase domain-containing protein n=1 Tax=Haliangium sp. TaxID=2663208 RepID=UPI003D0AF0B1
MAINSDRPSADGDEETGPVPTESASTNLAPTSPAAATPSTDETTAASVDELVAAGRHAEAADLARAQGDPARAAGLYERIWEFAEAAVCARAAGDLGRALQNALDAHDEALVAELAAALDGQGEAGQRVAMEVFVRRRRLAEAGVRAEAVGELATAVDYYRRGHRELEAARLLEAMGRDREAGRLLERLVSVAAPGRELALARLRLGRLLVRRMQYGPAAEHLQEAAREPAARGPAQASLIVCLAGMGLRDAAREVLLQARADDPTLAADLDGFLRAQREAERALEAPSAPPADADDDADEADDGSRTRAPGPDGEARTRGSASGKDDDVQILGGRYRLDELLGAGGTGRVYHAFDEVSERQVAIKLFALSRDHQAYERFVREARIASGLRHPNLVEVYDFSAEQGYLVMEYMPGGSLESRLGGAGAASSDAGRRPLSERAVRRLARELLAGLERAHRRGIIHRDIKPANIFFDARGTAKLGDFGVAHLLDLGQTQTGGLIGTLAYMAPEQITGAPLTIAADLYALGVTLYEALTGRLPLLGPDFVAQHLGEIPPPASEVAQAAIEPGWDPILARLLAKSPSERYDGVDPVREALAALSLDDGPTPLLLRRAPTPTPAASPGGATEDALLASLTEPAADAGAPGAPDQPGEVERYQFATALGTTPISRLTRAVDTVLGRSVVIERYLEGGLDEATERRLYALARGGSPFLQWALAYDRDAGVAVYEAPNGEPLAESLAGAGFEARAAVGLLMRLARAVAPLHERGLAHGAISPATVVIDEQRNPTVLISGLGPAPAQEPHPRADVAAILSLVAEAAGVNLGPSADVAAMAAALLDGLVPDLASAPRDRVMARGRADTGEALYAFAELFEVTLLQTLASAQP